MHNTHLKRKQNLYGSISILVLVFGMMFSVLVGGLVLTVAIFQNNARRTDSFERALTVAQAGAEYYRWHLAHNPSDYTDGTAGPGPYVHTLEDPYGATDGTFSLTITPPSSGSSYLTIKSTGWTQDQPDITRTVTTTYGIPAITKYALLQNSNMWYGQKTTIYGKVFANGGIRMDGTHDNTVQSAKSTYTCGLETGCDPAEVKPGVWGTGGPQELWQFPVPAVDFNGIALDFSEMKKQATQSGGVYLPPSSDYGYHVVFAADGTYSISKITNAKSKDGWSVENGCESLPQEIQNETLIGTYSIAEKPLIFAENHVWVEGVVNGRVTVAAAKFPLEVNTINIWIPNNITYLAKDGASDLGLIAQNDIRFVLEIPQEFEVDAALFAQKGRVIRHNYKYPGCGSYPQAVRQQLILYGSLISNMKSYWSYGQGGAGFGTDPTSGFSLRDIIYDPALYYSPPPYFPTQGEYEFISWTEE